MNKHDKYFLNLAKKISQDSKDPSTQAGCVIVNPKGALVSSGFNGFPQSMKDVPEQYSEREIKYSRIIHAEMNAIIFAQKDLSNCTAYIWPLLPCDRCAVHLIQAGIIRVVSSKISEEKESRWKEIIDKSKLYFSECNVICDEIEL